MRVTTLVGALLGGVVIYAMVVWMDPGGRATAAGPAPMADCVADASQAGVGVLWR